MVCSDSLSRAMMFLRAQSARQTIAIEQRELCQSPWCEYVSHKLTLSGAAALVVVVRRTGMLIEGGNAGRQSAPILPKFGPGANLVCLIWCVLLAALDQEISCYSLSLTHRVEAYLLLFNAQQGTSNQLTRTAPTIPTLGNSKPAAADSCGHRCCGSKTGFLSRCLG